MLGHSGLKKGASSPSLSLFFLTFKLLNITTTSSEKELEQLAWSLVKPLTSTEEGIILRTNWNRTLLSTLLLSKVFTLYVTYFSLLPTLGVPTFDKKLPDWDG